MYLIGWAIKEQKLRQLRAFCSTHSEYGDLLSFLPEEADDKSPLTEDQEDTEQLGYIYVFRYGTTNQYKVGRSNDVHQRNGQIDRQTPEPITVWHSFKTDDPSGIEAYWHNRFKKAGKEYNQRTKHLRGEWFRLDADDLRALKRRTKFM